MLLQGSRQEAPAQTGWSVHATPDGRLYYCNHLTQTSSWLPPAETWSVTSGGFPYGWEQGVDRDGKTYFINHLNKTTTYEDPRKDWAEEPPQPREVELIRHPELGFGFVAGSEKPVIVRFVTEGGPSVDKLQPGDQILIINGEDVKKAPRDHVIQLVRSCKETVKLTVCQPPLDNSARKSALLSAAKKAKLKSNPSRVRFAEGVVVNGSPLFPPSTFSLGESSVPFMPNVLKVFLENGQTKSFKYDSNTTVQDVVVSLHQKLCIKAVEHFSLVVEHVKSLRRNKLTLLDPMEPLARIAARPGAHNLRCLFRVAFVPKDACDLAQRDLIAFEYLYMQCCNDVVQERYAPELKYDIALRLAALHIHQHAIANNMAGKVTIKAIEREFGLERFVPVSLMSTMKRKELRKLISHFLKLNHNLSPSGQKSLTSLQAKLYYLNIISELPSYGAKCFSTNIRDSNMERVILVSPKFGISQISGLRNSIPVPLADIEQMSLVTVTREDELSRCVRIAFPSSDEKELVLSLEDRDAEELVLVLRGYFRLLTGEDLPVHQDRDPIWNEDAAPPYHSQHQVVPAKWSYASSNICKHHMTFSNSPPYHPVEVVKPNSDFGSLSRQKQHSSNITQGNRMPYGVDNNMNNMSGLYIFNGASKEFSSDVSRKENVELNSQKLGFDLQSVLSMEILESDSYIEARNEEVLRRVAEMQELVHNSEQYLTQQQQHVLKEESDSEGSHISSLEADAPGELKHSDSLLLLTQGQKLITDAVNEVVQTIDLGEVEPSESDTDSMSTPTNSPSHRPLQGKDYNSYHNNTALKPSGSSFGLHSPDNFLPVGVRPTDYNIQDFLKKLQEDNNLPYDFAEGTLYLDPDIIDLTLIPPPITPDEEGLYGLPPQLSMPPTPFADSSPLNSELQAYEEIINHKNIRSMNMWQRNNCAPYDLEHDKLLDEVLAMELNKTLSQNFTPPSVPGNQLSDLDLNLDLETFLATCTVPPPTDKSLSSVELTPEEIMSYIIPPPPSCAPEDEVNGQTMLVNQPHLSNGYSPINNSIHIRDTSSSSSSSASSTNSTNNVPQNTRVIEYATVNRKGAFSCCGKHKESTDIQPPPRNGQDIGKPPARPPKYYEKHSEDSRINGTPPPILPPRNDYNQIQQPSWIPPKKPPLPPVPSQEVLRRTAQCSPVPTSRGNKSDVLSVNQNNLANNSPVRNGHIISHSNSTKPSANRDALFCKSDLAIVSLLEQLDDVVDQCSKAQSAGGGACMDEIRFQVAKDLLTNEARQLVTASKMLVKSATEGQDVSETLGSCMQHLHRLTELASDVTAHTTSPLQTRNLVMKVRDVAAVFRDTLPPALGMGMSSETVLLQRAESLASVLATLLRSLRVFSP